MVHAKGPELNQAHPPQLATAAEGKDSSLCSKDLSKSNKCVESAEDREKSSGIHAHLVTDAVLSRNR